MTFKVSITCAVNLSEVHTPNDQAYDKFCEYCHAGLVSTNTDFSSVILVYLNLTHLYRLHMADFLRKYFVL